MSGNPVPRRSRVWNALGTKRAAQVVTVLVIVYFLVIGLLVFGYVQVSSCLATYANKSAVATEARAAAAAQDRQLNDAISKLADIERDRSRANDRALGELLVTLGRSQATRDRSAAEAAFKKLLEVTSQSEAIYQSNERERDRIQVKRLEIEKARAQNPPPPPPSESC